MHRLRWDDLQFIQAVVDHGSLSAAARALGVNHATVHRRIGTLEETYGVSLFERLPIGYRLRPEGRDLLGALSRIDSEVGRIERSLRGARQSIEGTFRLTTTDTIATLLMPRHLAVLKDLHPGVHIELGITNHRVDMSEPVAEIAVRPIRRLPDNMSGAQAGELTFRVFGSPDYLSRNPSAVIEELDWLGVTPSIARSPAGEWQAEHLLKTPTLTADSFFPLAKLAEESLGLAMLPVFVGRAFPGLVEVSQIPDRPTIPFWVASHRDLCALEPINALIEFFAGALSQDPALAAA